MELVAYGISHSTAPLAVRERVSFNHVAVPDALLELKHQVGVDEAAILSTCNRMEIYCSLDQKIGARLIDWLHHFHGMTPGILRPFLYEYPHENAIRHILRVASGMDSMVPGEPQILGQLKDAYKKASNAGSIGCRLNRLFQHSFKVAKEVRSNTAIGNHPVSVAYAGVRLAQQIFGELGNKTVLLIGAGETIELVAKHFYETGLHRMIIAGRTLERAQRLAKMYSVYAIRMEAIPEHLAEADIVVSSTASQSTVLGRDVVERAVRARQHQPMLMVDIAVPRDIDIGVGDIDDIYLYNVDDLQGIIQENLCNRRNAVKQAEKIIDTQAHEFIQWLDSLEVVPTIRALRNQAERIRVAAVRRGLNKLKNGVSPEQVLRETGHILTNKLIHSPSRCLRKASTENRDKLRQVARELYALDSDLKAED